MRRLHQRIILTCLRVRPLSTNSILPDCQSTWKDWEATQERRSSRGDRTNRLDRRAARSFANFWRAQRQTTPKSPPSLSSSCVDGEGDILRLEISSESCCLSTTRLLSVLSATHSPTAASTSFSSLHLVVCTSESGLQPEKTSGLTRESLTYVLHAVGAALKKPFSDMSDDGNESSSSRSALSSIRTLKVSEVRHNHDSTLWSTTIATNRENGRENIDSPVQALCHLIRYATQLEAVSLERLSWELAEAQQVSEAIASRGVATLPSLSTTCGLKELHLSGMEPLLLCPHFLETCLPSQQHLEALSLDHCLLTTHAVTDSASLLDPTTITLWQQLLAALSRGMGGWHRLRRWSVVNCGLTGDSLREALVSLPADLPPQAVSLTHINLSHNRLTHHSSIQATDLMFFVALFFGRVRQLEVLTMRSCGLTASNMDVLSSVLLSAPGRVSTLHRLLLDSNPIRDDGLRALLAGGRSSWPSLTSFSLSRCGLTGRSLIPLCQLLERKVAREGQTKRQTSACSQLQQLSLTMNDFRSLPPEEYLFDTAPPTEGEDDDAPLQLFCYDNRFMAGDGEYRNRGTHKVPTSYELDRRDAEEGRVRYRGNDTIQPTLAQPTPTPASSSEVWRRFGEALTAGCPSLELLDVSDVGISTSESAAFFSSLRLPKLGTLLVASNAQLCGSVESTDALYGALLHSAQTLDVLDLRFTGFDDYGVSLMCDGYYEQDDINTHLPSWRLRDLLLSHTAISDEGAQLLVEAMWRDQKDLARLTVQQLSCSGLRIGSHTKKLLEMLRRDGVVQQLEI